VWLVTVHFQDGCRPPYWFMFALLTTHKGDLVVSGYCENFTVMHYVPGVLAQPAELKAGQKLSVCR